MQPSGGLHTWEQQQSVGAATAAAPNGLKAVPTATLIAALPATLSGSLHLPDIFLNRGRSSALPSSSAQVREVGHAQASSFVSRQQRRMALDRFFSSHVSERIAARQSRKAAHRERRLLWEEDEDDAIRVGGAQGASPPAVARDAAVRQELRQHVQAVRDVLATQSSETQACLFDVLVAPIVAEASTTTEADAAAPLSVAEKLLIVILRTSAVAAVLGGEETNAGVGVGSAVWTDSDGEEGFDAGATAAAAAGSWGADLFAYKERNDDVFGRLMASPASASLRGAAGCVGDANAHNTSSESLAPQREKVEAAAGGAPAQKDKRRKRRGSHRSRDLDHDMRRKPPQEQRCAFTLEPRCWLSPLTIGLVERSNALRDSLSWSCSPDPVVTATLNRGGELHPLSYPTRGRNSGTGGTHSLGGVAGLMSVSGVSSDALLQAMTTSSTAEGRMHSVCDAMLARSGLPLVHGSTSAADLSPAAPLPTTLEPMGCWAAAEDGAVVALFEPKLSPSSSSSSAASSLRHGESTGDEGRGEAAPTAKGPSPRCPGEEEEEEAWQQTSSLPRPPLSLLFTPQYSSDLPVCAMIYVALHRCIVGLPDPYFLTRVCSGGGDGGCDTSSSVVGARRRGGRMKHLVYADEQEVHISLGAEFLAGGISEGGLDSAEGATRQPGAAAQSSSMKRQRADGDATSPAGERGSCCSSSGLLSLLQWGCRCGTLFLRLSHLCEVAGEKEYLVGLGSYGQAALEALRLSLSLLRRLVVELAARPGGPHRISFPELLDAQQRLACVEERIASLANMLAVSLSPRWRAMETLPLLSSATLLTTLYSQYSARSLNAMGEYHQFLGGVGGSDPAGNLSSNSDSDDDDDDSNDGDGGSRRGGVEEMGRSEGKPRSLRKGDECAWASSPEEEERNAARRERRKDKLCRSFDPVAFVLVRAMRPLHAMMHSWLTRGELNDPFDEFFIVPARGHPHSSSAASPPTTTTTTGGYLLDCSPQRLPIFISADTASDMLHAGISLRVLRAAATHVILSAKHELIALEGRDDDAEEDVAERNDAHLMGSLVKGFLSSLVGQDPQFALANPLPMVNPLSEGDEARRGKRKKALNADGDGAMEGSLVRGRVNYWRDYYSACNAVLIAAVAQTGGDDDLGQPLDGDDRGEYGVEEEEDEGERVEAVGGGDPHARSTASGESGEPAKTVADRKLSQQQALATRPPEEKDCATSVGEEMAAPFSPTAGRQTSLDTVASHITITMGSDDDDDDGSNGGAATEEDGSSARYGRFPVREAKVGAPSAPSSSARDAARRDSVLGLHSVAARNAIRMGSIGTSSAISSSSAASSRVTTALYGAITEELRQVVRVVQQQEEQTEQARQRMRQEYERSILRQRREARLTEWKAQRVALRLERIQAIRGTVDELREVYDRLRQEQQRREREQTEGQQQCHEDEEESGEAEEKAARAAAAATAAGSNELGKLVIPLSQKALRRHRRRGKGKAADDPKRVLLYAWEAASEEDEEAEEEGSNDARSEAESGHSTQGTERTLSRTANSLQRRRGVAFAATTTTAEGAEQSATPRSHRTKRIMFNVSEPARSATGAVAAAAAPSLLSSSSRSYPLSSALVASHSYGRRTSASGASLLAEAAAATTASILSLPTRSQRRYMLPTLTELGGGGASALLALGGGQRGASSAIVPPYANATTPLAVDSAYYGGATPRAAATSVLTFTNQRPRPRRASLFATPALIHPLPLPTYPSTAAADEAGEAADAEEVKSEKKAVAPMGPDDEAKEKRPPSARQLPPLAPTTLLSQDQRKIHVRIGDVTAEALAAISSAQQHQREVNEAACGSGDEGQGGEQVRKQGEETQEKEPEAAPPGHVPHDHAGFAHPEEIYVIADINDDEFLAKRVGPKTYSRDELDALLAELAQQQERLRATSVEAPGYLEHCRRVALQRLHGEPDKEAKDDGMGEDHWAEDDVSAHPPQVWQDEQFDYDMGGVSRNSYIGTRLECFDGRLALADVDVDGDGNNGNGQRKSRNVAKHSGYRSYQRLLRELQGLHLDSPAQADSLLWCARYYLGLARYTSRYLTHKALQLTLLPPYGSLYRLLRQLLDVLLLQNGLTAARVVEAWVDGAVRPSLVDGGGSGLFLEAGHPTTLQAMAALPPSKRFNARGALHALNSAFQKEWSTCVLGGDSTMAVEWAPLLGSESGSQRRDSQRRESAFDTMFNTAGMWLDDDEAERRRRYMSKYSGALRKEEEVGGGAGTGSGADWMTGAPSPLFLLAELRLVYDEPHTQAGSSSSGEDRGNTTEKQNRSSHTRAVQSAHFSAPPSSSTFFGLLPSHVMRDYADVFTTLLFWKTAEQLATHTWRDGLRCGEPDAFFFCNSTRYVVLALQQRIWYGVSALCGEYRKSLQFDSGVLFGYSCLEAFTEDHRRFITECRFTAMLSPSFARSRRLVYRLLQLTEDMQRVLRAADDEMCAAERRAMAAYHALVDTDSDDGNEEEATRKRRKGNDVPPRKADDGQHEELRQHKQRQPPLHRPSGDSNDEDDDEDNDGDPLTDPSLPADMDFDAIYAVCLEAAAELSSSSSSSDSASASATSGDTEEKSSSTTARTTTTTTSTLSEKAKLSSARTATRGEAKPRKGTKSAKSARAGSEKKAKSRRKAKAGGKKGKEERKAKKRARAAHDKAIIASTRTGRRTAARNPATDAVSAPAMRSASAGVTTIRKAPLPQQPTVSPAPATPTTTPRAQQRRSATPSAGIRSHSASAGAGHRPKTSASAATPPHHSQDKAAARGPTSTPPPPGTAASRERNEHEKVNSNERLRRQKEQRSAETRAARAARRRRKAEQLKEHRRGVFLSIAKRTIQEAHETQRRAIRDQVRSRLRTLTQLLRKLLREFVCIRDACTAGLEEGDGVGATQASPPNRPRKSRRGRGEAGGSVHSGSDDDDAGSGDSALLRPDEDMRAYRDPDLALSSPPRWPHRKNDEEDAAGWQGASHGFAVTGDVQYQTSTEEQQRQEWHRYRRKVLAARTEQMNSCVRLVEELLLSLKRSI